MIWHYTSQYAAHQIVSSMNFRLTRQDYLDDGNEFQHFLRVTKTLDSNIDHSQTAHDYAKWSSALSQLLIPDRTFVGCFSRNCDDVSQWERYADMGKGVAIGFDSSMLEIEEVSYKNDKELEEIVHSLLNEFKDDSVGFANVLKPMRKTIKQKQYASEDEVRICKSGNVRDQLFFSRKDTLCPYIELKLPDGIVKEIMLGPRSRMNAENAWRDFVDPEFQFNNANVFRDWTDRSSDKVTIKISKSDCFLHP